MGIKTFVSLGTTHMLSFIVIPLLNGGRSLPYAVWLPEGGPPSCYWAVFGVETFSVVVLLFLVTGTDGLFVAFCGTLGIQFRLLRHRMRKLKGSLGEDVIRGTMRECILHQKVLLEGFRRVERVFQFTLCSQYALIVVTICMNLYVLSIR